MKISDKISTLFSPLDVVLIEKDFELLIGKNEEPDISDSILDYAQEVLGAGEHPSRNPSCWQTFFGQDIEIGSKEWREGIANLLRLTSKHTVSELDNERNHLLVSVKLEVLVINAKQLPESVFHGAKCTSVQTPFGAFPVTAE